MVKLKSQIIYFCFALVIVVFSVFVSWQNSGGLAKTEDIKFPVSELGNCKNETECGAFCDKDENILPCVNFAESHSLMNSKEAARARKMAEIGVARGPGDCHGQDECEKYCDDSKNIKECVAFGRDHDLMSSEEFKEAGKVLAAFEKGAVMPGGCKNKEVCEKYCDESEHNEECIDFAQKAGFITSDEATIARKTGGKGPGGCRGRENCDDYCNNQTHMEECINFAIQYDLMPSQEKEEAMKALAALQKGVKMPNCRGKDECDTYCSEPQNMSECVAFAEAAGFMNHDEAAMAKKMLEMGMARGPGGCKNRQECEHFCDNPDNMVTCVDFAEKTGMMGSEEAARARKMAELGITSGPGGCKNEKDCEHFCESPENMEVCVDFAVKAGMMSPDEAKKAKNGIEMMKMGGPGGCHGNECEKYCEDPSHAEACIDFAQKQGMMSNEEAEMAREGMRFMRKCGGPEECLQYCKKNSSDPICGGAGGVLPPREANPFKGKCATEKECANYCMQNSQDRACQAMMPQGKQFREMIGPGAEEMMHSQMPNSKMMPENQMPGLERMRRDPLQRIQKDVERQIQKEMEQRIKEFQTPIQKEMQQPLLPSSGDKINQSLSSPQSSIIEAMKFLLKKSKAALLEISNF